MTRRKYIGSNQQQDIVLSGKYISDRHAVLIFESGKVYIEDLDSTFGTFINGNRIKSQTELTLNDRVKIGAHLLAWKDYVPNESVSNPILVKDLFLPFGKIHWRDYKILLLVIFGIVLVLPFGVPTVLLYIKNFATRKNPELRAELDVWQYYEPLVIILLIICGYILLNLTIKLFRGLNDRS